MLVIGLLDGRPVTGGAYPRFDAETAELKRIWTDSTTAGGYAKLLLDELESEITSGDTGGSPDHGDRQPEAEALTKAPVTVAGGAAAG